MDEVVLHRGEIAAPPPPAPPTPEVPVASSSTVVSSGAPLDISGSSALANVPGASAIPKRSPIRLLLTVVVDVLSGLSFLVAVGMVGIILFLGLAGLRPMYVVSDSMVPTFKTNDMLLVNDRDKHVSVGDMVSYEAAWFSNRQVTHRVISVEGDTIITKGDANPAADPSFTSDRLMGKIVAIFPNLGLLFRPWVIWGATILGLFFTGLGELLRLPVRRYHRAAISK